MLVARPTCLRLLMQAALRAFSLAFDRAGRSSPARMAMMAITTSNSMRVNARAEKGAGRKRFRSPRRDRFNKVPFTCGEDNRARRAGEQPALRSGGPGGWQPGGRNAP